LVSSTLHDGGDATTVTEHTSYRATVSGDIDTETVTRNPGTAAETSTARQFAYGVNGTLTGITTTHPDATTTTVVQEYDAAGNLTRAADGTRYAHNAANRQTSEITPTGEALTTSYWASGQRANLTTEDIAGIRTTGFYWDGTTLINDTHTTAEAAGTASYLLGPGGTRHTRTSGGTGNTAYFTHDRHGNVSSLTDTSGTPTIRYAYTDYGTPTLHTNTVAEADGLAKADASRPAAGRVGNAAFQPFQYAGEYTNPTGTQHLAAREYHPATMRFTTADTAQLHNTYAYADLNPIMNLDPSGHTALPDWANALIAGLGVALSFIGVVATGGLASPLAPLAYLGLVSALYGTVVEATHLAVGIAKATGTTVAIDEQALEYASWAAAAAGGAELAAVGIAKLAIKLATKQVTRAAAAGDNSQQAIRQSRDSPSTDEERRHVPIAEVPRSFILDPVLKYIPNTGTDMIQPKWRLTVENLSRLKPKSTSTHTLKELKKLKEPLGDFGVSALKYVKRIFSAFTMFRLNTTGKFIGRDVDNLIYSELVGEEIMVAARSFGMVQKELGAAKSAYARVHGGLDHNIYLANIALDALAGADGLLKRRFL
jgi:RHS repeat-associated protein